MASPLSPSGGQTDPLGPADTPTTAGLTGQPKKKTAPAKQTSSLPPVVVAPKKTAKSDGKPGDVPQELWDAILVSAKKYGVTPQVLAGIWRAESGSTYPNPYVNSSGYGGLFGTTNWNASTQDQADLAASTLRADIKTTGNLHDALLLYSGGGYSTVPGVTVPVTAAQKVADQKRAADAKLASPGYIQLTTDLSVVKSEALAGAKANAHIKGTPSAWVTVNTDRNGNVVSLGTASGFDPPKNVLTQGGRPLTQSDVDNIWGQRYEGVFEQFAGRRASAADIANTLESGLTPYAVQQQLAGIDPKTGKFTPTSTFKNSPQYKSVGPGIVSYATKVLGHAPPDGFVARAVANQWDTDTLNAQLQALPSYEKGPEFQGKLVGNRAQYEQIYGAPDKTANQWLHTATLNGWTKDQVGDALRSAPEYVHSQEYAANASSFLDALGLITGGRQSALKPAKKVAGQLNPEAPLTPTVAAA